MLRSISIDGRPGLPISALATVAFLALTTAAACGGGSSEPTYEDIATEVRQTCAGSGACHGGQEEGQAMLNFKTALDEGMPITELLNNVPACEYDLMPRVKPGDPEGSWLMVKLDGAHSEDGTLLFEPDPDWDHGLEQDAGGGFPESTCPLTENGEISFGLLMPLNAVVAEPLPPEKLEMFRRWIELGAPGPEGS